MLAICIYDIYNIFKVKQMEWVMKKLIKFSTETIKRIQKYANNNHNGNFTKAVIDLCEKSLAEK